MTEVACPFKESIRQEEVSLHSDQLFWIGWLPQTICDHLELFKKRMPSQRDLFRRIEKLESHFVARSFLQKCDLTMEQFWSLLKNVEHAINSFPSKRAVSFMIRSMEEKYSKYGRSQSNKRKQTPDDLIRDVVLKIHSSAAVFEGYSEPGLITICKNGKKIIIQCDPSDFELDYNENGTISFTEQLTEVL